MISLLILLLIILLGVFIGMRPMISVTSARPITDKDTAPQQLKASVIVLCLQSDTTLSEYLPIIYSQDYEKFEVIVVCDCNAETAKMLSEQFTSYPNLHITFLPPGSRRISRRKLALTIGIKAATGDVVVTTSTLVLPTSNQWLRALMAPFNDSVSKGETGSVSTTMGVISPNTEEFPRRQRSAVVYERNTASIQWVGAALNGHPFRCDGFNMAFRRELFFKLKGYSSSILLIDGDDDIFLRELAQYGECIPVLDPSAAMMTAYGENSLRILNEYREQYLFTRKYLPKRPFLIRSFSSWCHWLALPASVFPISAGIYAILTLIEPGYGFSTQSSECAIRLHRAATSLWGSLPGSFGESATGAILSMGIALLLLLIYACITSILYKRSARIVNPFRKHYNVFYPVWRALWQPISNFFFKTSRRGDPSSHYTYRNG